MKDAEDEAFDELEKRQGGGYQAKRKMAADKLLEEATRNCNNIDEQRALDALMRDAQPVQEDSCFCHDGASLQMVSGGAAPEGYLGKVTLLIDGEYVDYVKAQPMQEPVALHEAVISAWSLREVYFDEEGIPSMHRSPPQRPWVGLTDEEIAQGNKESWVDKQAFESAVWWAETKLKEKNT